MPSSFYEMTGSFIHNIDPVIGQIVGMYLWWYGMSYTLGFLGLFFWLRIIRSAVGLDVRQVYDLTIFMAIGVLIGGRMVEVIFYEWAYYSTHPLHIIWIWLGGMSTHGILFGGTLGTWLFCQRYQINFLSLADELVIPAAFIMGLGRMGNFIDGQIVGSVTDVLWAVKFPDADGFRHPVVLYDGLKNLFLIPLLLLIRRIHPPRGIMLGAFLFGYGFFRIFIDFFREYRVELYGLPPGQEFNLGMCIVGIVMIVWAVRRRRIGGKYFTRSSGADSLAREGGNAMSIRRIILLVLLLCPLVIPGDWTQDIPVRYGKRHEGMAHSTLYPPMVTVSKVEER
jgi:phosphatidylglycerol:prolipoprotein diacylglycerol transferase